MTYPINENLPFCAQFSGQAHNMQLKSLPSVVRTWQPVIKFAGANSLPERPRRLTGC